jgi:ribosomal protein S18 acetylase RimI-like enzyme
MRLSRRVRVSCGSPPDTALPASDETRYRVPVSDAGRIEVTRTYLEMKSRDQLVAADSREPGLRIERAWSCPASFFRYLYAEVGRAYRWVDRLDWTDERIRRHLAQEGTSLFVLHVRGSPAGYFELQRHDDGSTEVAYFGLLPEFIGRGLGKHLLTRAVEQAFEDGATRVWLHTCTLDAPAALPNYERRGFRVFRSEKYWADGTGRKIG